MRRSQHRLALVVIGCLILYLGLTNAQIHKNPLVMDEVDYFQCMTNVVDLGLPLYYAGEVRIDSDLTWSLGVRTLAGHRLDFYRFRPETGVMKEAYFALEGGNSRYTWCMWQPPLYIYLGSVAVRLADLSVQSSELIRYHNLLYGCIAMAGIVKLSLILYPQRWRSVSSAALLLYVTCDLVVRGSVLTDYSASLAPCIAVWYTVSFVSSMRRQQVTLFLILMATASLWTAFGLGLSLLASSFVVLLLLAATQAPRPRLWPTAMAIGAGVGCFLGTYWMVCRMSGLPFEQPFLHSYARIVGRATDTGLVASAVSGLSYCLWYAKEVGPITCIAAAAVMLRFLTRRRVLELDRSVPVIVSTFSVALQSLGGAQAYGFPKYLLFVLPLVMVSLAGEGRYLLLACRGTARWVARCAAAFVLSVQMTGACVSSVSPGYTLYNRSIPGAAEAGHILAALSAPDEVTLCTKDVGFHAERRFVEWKEPLLSDAEALGELVDSRGIRCVVKSIRVSPEVQNALELRYTQIGVSGSHQVLCTTLTDPE